MNTRNTPKGNQQSVQGTKQISRLQKMRETLNKRFNGIISSIELINHQTNRVYNVSIIPDGEKFQVVKTWGYVNLAKNETRIECQLLAEAKNWQKKLIDEKQSIESPNPWVIHSETKEKV